MQVSRPNDSRHFGRCRSLGNISRHIRRQPGCNIWDYPLVSKIQISNPNWHIRCSDLFAYYENLQGVSYERTSRPGVTSARWRFTGAEAEASNGGMNMSRYISKSVSSLTLTVVICGGLYALSLWVIGQAVFPFQANSSMLTGLDNKVVGSHQIAQPFTKDEYFQPGSSAASSDASASASALAASNNFFHRQNPDLGVQETPLLQRPTQRVCLFYDC